MFAAFCWPKAQADKVLAALKTAGDRASILPARTIGPKPVQCRHDRIGHGRARVRIAADLGQKVQKRGAVAGV